MTNSALTVTRPATSVMFRALFRADLTVVLRTFRTTLLNLAIPIVILLVTGPMVGGSAGATKTTGFGSVGLIIGLSLTYGLMASSLMGYSVSIAQDRQSGVFQRLRVTPAPTWAIMSSRLLVQFVVDVVMTVVVVVIGTTLHHLRVGVVEVLLLGAVSLGGGMMFLAIGQALVALVRSASVVNAVGRILYAVLLLLGLVGLGGLLGDTLETVSLWSPVGALITLFAGVIDVGSWGGTQTNAVIACSLYLAVGAFVGIRWFRWEAR